MSSLNSLDLALNELILQLPRWFNHQIFSLQSLQLVLIIAALFSGFLILMFVHCECVVFLSSILDPSLQKFYLYCL